MPLFRPVLWARTACGTCDCLRDPISQRPFPGMTGLHSQRLSLSLSLCVCVCVCVSASLPALSWRVAPSTGCVFVGFTVVLRRHRCCSPSAVLTKMPSICAWVGGSVGLGWVASGQRVPRCTLLPKRGGGAGVQTPKRCYQGLLFDFNGCGITPCAKPMPFPEGVSFMSATDTTPTTQDHKHTRQRMQQ